MKSNFVDVGAQCTLRGENDDDNLKGKDK